MNKRKRVFRERHSPRTQVWRVTATLTKYKVTPGTVGEFYTVLVDDIARDPDTVTISDFNELVFLNATPTVGSTIKLIF